VHKFHHHVRLPVVLGGIKDGGDVGVVELGHRLRFAKSRSLISGIPTSSSRTLIATGLLQARVEPVVDGRESALPDSLPDVVSCPEEACRSLRILHRPHVDRLFRGLVGDDINDHGMVSKLGLRSSIWYRPGSRRVWYRDCSRDCRAPLM
jgi:hypothetical protein